MDRGRDSKTEISGICPDTWICHDPVFACDAVNPDLLEFSPWSGHRRFAYDYVRNVRPAVIAELGTFYGCSAFAFQQAILDGGLDTVFTAVDTWQGDAFTREDYRYAGPATRMSMPAAFAYVLMRRRACSRTGL